MAERSDNLFQVINGKKGFAARELFSDVSFAINEGEHVGVIGPNGAGKSTLFKCILGEESFDAGHVVKRSGLRIGYLAQHDDWQLEELVEDYVQRKAQMPLWDIKQLGEGLGLTQEIFSRQVSALNGGMRMRAKLLALLVAEPDLMMLDEPTNYLDLESLLVLESFLQSFKGAFLLISHDREFLRRTTDHILEVELGEVTKFNGALDDYFEQKESLRAQLESRAMSLAQRRKEILDFVARFGAKATKARQAQSRLKSLNRMEVIDLKALPVRARIKIPAPTHCGKDIFRAQELDVGYPSRKVISQCEFEIRNGDRVAVVGYNGAGKSTLLKTLAGDLPPLNGKVDIGYQVSWSFYAQHVSESLRESHSVLQAMGEDAHPTVSSQDVLDMAGSLLFSGDDVHKKVSVLSGGERSRVCLGRMLLRRSPVLILDEPTNHLDFQTVEALGEALRLYQGTIVFVSHDRSFVARVASKIIEIQNGQAYVLDGSYDDYVWSVTEGVLSQRGREKIKKSPEPIAPVKATAPNPMSHEVRKERQRELFQSQKKVEIFERNLAKFDAALKDKEAVVAAGAASQETFQEIAQLIQNKSDTENEWVEEMEKIEQLKLLLEK